MEYLMSFMVIACCHAGCGIEFAVTTAWERARRCDHANWYCPNGHVQCFMAENTEQRAIREKRELELKLQAQLNAANHAKAVAELERDKVIRAKRKMERRIKAGVCPCCNRTFGDIAKHMVSKHKDFALPPGNQLNLIEKGA